jgi:transcriptional regulator with XRE-family HTH domain
MNPNPTSHPEGDTFGQCISIARKAKGWSQKELASKIIREDGNAISPQYLNDIEHDRRSPTSDHMVNQFVVILEIDSNWLYYLAGRFPDYIRERKYTRHELNELMMAFRAPPPKDKGSK